jgi:predicted O-linked N-acetylglucosamine transferase (SPINDLY family)
MELGGNNLIALVQQAMLHQQAGRLDDAEAHYQRALAIDPNQFEALHFLGLLEAQRSRLAEADRLVERSLSINGMRAEAHSNHARILRQMGRQQDAIARCDRALAINPFLIDALLLRGNALRDLGRLPEALGMFDRALSINPNEPLAHYNRGLTLTMAWGSEQGALASLEKALALRPRDPDFLIGHARALAALLRQDEALRSFDEALATRPDDVDGLLGRGDTLHKMGRWPEATASYEQACAAEPHNVRARLALCMGQLPVIYETEAQIEERRKAYEQQLQHLCAQVEQDRAGFAKDVGLYLPFFLAYQGRSDRDLQQSFGALVCRAMAAQHPAVPLAPPPGPSERLRIGIVSGYFCRHTVWRIMIKGWLSQLDRRKFEVFGYHTSAMRDLQTETAEKLCEHFVQGPKLIDDWPETIAADAPHVLLYPEINMDPATAALAALRLAPVQCMSWGHPETSGYSTIDYFLTSELMEPPDADAHYTEALVRLPNLSVYYEPFEVTPAQMSRQEVGLRPDATVFWCGQSLFKYLPQDDDTYPRIAQAVPDCQFAFIEHPQGKSATDVFRQRLQRVFAAHGLAAADYCVILPRMLQPQFVAAIGLCDIVLDSLGWSGFTTTLDGFHHDHPVVTLAGPLMRGRHTTAVLTMMGVTEMIARTVDEYVAVAQRLATDATWRNAVKERMRATKHRVYRDRTRITALEEFLTRVARDRRAAS